MHLRWHEHSELFAARSSGVRASRLRAAIRELQRFGYRLRLGEKASDVILSIVAYPRWVTLFFFDKAILHDPNSILDGTGKRIRSIRLQSPSDLDRADVRQLISEAFAPHAGALAGCPRLTLVVRSIASKRRARRPRERKASKVSVNSPGKSSRSK